MFKALVVEHPGPLDGVSLADIARKNGFEIELVHSLRSARSNLAKSTPDVIFINLNLPDGDGMELVEEWEDRDDVQVVVVTAEPTLETAVAAVRKNVLDYLHSPITETQIQSVLEAVKERIHKLPERQARVVPAGDVELKDIPGLIGDSPAMQEVYKLVRTVAPSDATVLIQGESGTGKELIANAIHSLSARRNGPFLAINCGAIPENLIATELFGHERGSFSGADRQHRGYFERAAGGTLFLDEITEMPQDLQVHLLRILETGVFLRVGGTKEIVADTRIIAATNRQPEQAVLEGKLREDLFYRLQVFPIQLPPLRARGADVLLIARYFLEQLNKSSTTQKVFSSELETELLAYEWPGNVRELSNAVSRAYLLAGPEITPEHLSVAPLRPPESPLKPQELVGKSLEDIERHLILATLQECRGNKKMAAETLGVSLKTLYNRLKQYQGATASEGKQIEFLIPRETPDRRLGARRGDERAS